MVLIERYGYRRYRRYSRYGYRRYGYRRYVYRRYRRYGYGTLGCIESMNSSEGEWIEKAIW